MCPDDLALEQRPNALDPVGVQHVMPDILARAVVDAVVVVIALKADERAMLVSHDSGASLDVIPNDGLDGFGAQARCDACPKFAVALKHAQNGDLALAALLAASALPRVLVLLLAADEGFVGLDHAFERTVERLRFDRVAQAVGHEPSGFLRHAKVFSELRAGDALLVRSDKPDREHPRTQRDFAVLKDRADLDGEPLATVAALVSAVVREVIDAGRFAVRAKRAVLPADRPEMVDCGLLVGDCGHHLKDGVELLHGGFLRHAILLAGSPIWVKHVYKSLKNDQTGEIVYVPPQSGDEVIAHMTALEKFVNDDAFKHIDPLVRMAIIHHQFESIHPFPDGNGRLGRILNVLYLTQQRLLDTPILYLSRYITRNKGDYYRLLQSVRENGDWEPWLIYMLSAVGETSAETIDLIAGMRILMADYKQKIRSEHRKIYSQDLLNSLFRHPYTRIDYIVNELNVTRQTAAKYLDQLSDDGLLVKHQSGRNVYFINAPLVALLQQSEK